MATLPQSSHAPERHVFTNAPGVLRYLNYAYPLLLLAFFLGAFTLRSIKTVPKPNANPSLQTGPGGKPLPASDPARNEPKKTSQDDIPVSQKRLFEWISLFAALTFAASGVNIVSHALSHRADGWWCGESVVIYVVGSFFVYSLFLISLLDTKPSPTSVHLSTWVFATGLELVLLAASADLYTHEHREPHAGPGRGKLRHGITRWEIIEISISLVRIVILLALIGFYLLFVALRNHKGRNGTRTPEETARLLPSEHIGQNGTAHYGSMPTGGKHSHTEGAPAGWSRPTNVPSRNWWEYFRGYSVFFPYLWPSKDRRLQIVVLICFSIVVFQRVINVMVPHQVGVIVNELSGEDGSEISMPWLSICMYILYRFLQGTNGLLGAARASLWIPIGQYSYRELSVASFEHVHSLSLDFHLGKRTGEVLSALGKGSSINTFLEQVTFSILPMLVDLFVAIGYFLIYFDAYYALICVLVVQHSLVLQGVLSKGA